MPSKPVNLLLVDDDPTAIQILSRMLAHYPNQRFASSGADALRLAREVRPDLIVLDADMPGMTGLEVCKALKADRTLATVPVIFASSHDLSRLEVAALEMGAVDFVIKPLNAAQVTSRVRARLMAARVYEQQVHARSGAAGRRAPRVLLVDDDVAAIQFMRSTLGQIGDFYFATSGEEALQLARTLVPDLILLDGQLPGIDGFAVCKALKAEARFKEVPIVFVTCFSDPRLERQAFELGAADFIAKPYAPAVLRARLRNLLDLKPHTDAEPRLAHPC